MASINDRKLKNSPIQIVTDKLNAHNEKIKVLKEDRFLGFITIRVDTNNLELKKAIEKILGLELPSLNKQVYSDKYRILWMSPTEFLIVTKEGKEKELVNKLKENAENQFFSAVDVTGGMTKIVLKESAEEILEKGTYVDLHPVKFKVNDIYSTNLAKAPVIIVKNSESEFFLFVRRSFSFHIINWLIDAV